MSQSVDTGDRSPVRPYSAIPRNGLWSMLRQILTLEAGRVDMLSNLRTMHEMGPVVSQGAGPIRFVNLFGPDANRFVLLDRDRIFSARRPWMQIMGRIFPNGLLLRDGEEHKHHRKIMHGAFTRPVLRDYAERMNPMIEEGLSGWGDRGGRLHAFGAFKELTLDIAASIFVGLEMDEGNRRMNGAFEDMVAASMSRIRLPLPGLEFNRGLQGRKFMLDLLGRMIPERRARAGGDMFSRLCRAETEEGERFADQEILDHMVFLMMAAHDTTTSTLTSMTYELAANPDWQERVREESLALDQSAVGLDDADRLESLTWVMRETLRRYPPLPVIPRISTEDFEWEGYRIPASSMVVVSPIHTHHMPEWWPDPFRFDPERFSPERAEDERHTHHWIPFGGGPHMCLGKRFAETQVRAIMHQMVRRYRWSVPDGYRMPVQQAPISKPRDGLPIEIESIS
ncbi:MAG: cytochrome P450 [Myxococcota bacterium]